MEKTCLLCGNFALDTIVTREYPEGFVVGKNNKFIETVAVESVGNTCGNVSSILPYLGVKSYPVAHFDLSEEGRYLKEDLERYGADTRFVLNTIQGGTALLRCTHKRDKATGEHVVAYHGSSPDSRFAKRKFIRERDEAPALLESLDFVPDVYFFDASEAGVRFLAKELRKKGTLVYFEPENQKDMKKFLKGVEVSDIVKFSHENISDLSFMEDYKDKLFIRTMGAEGLEFNLCGQGWQKVAPVPNDHVVDWEGAGDWTSSQFIACLCEKELLSIGAMDTDSVRACLEKACATASRSVSYLSSKGMIDAEKGFHKIVEEGALSPAPTRGIIGAVCGDIIGSVYEHRGSRTKNYNFKVFASDSHFSDDSVLTLAIARWLKGERTSEKLVESMVDLGRMYPGAGYGRGFKQWLKSDVQKPYGAGSNGAAMRVSAVGWACDTLEETLALAKQSADVSHSSEEGERGAMSVAAAIFLTRTGHSKEEIKAYIEKTFGYDLSRSVESIRETYDFEITCDKSVPEAIICWLQSSSYEETVRNAVSLGGDADTQAAIAGSIAAATPGMELPQEWADKALSLLTPTLLKILLDL